jgi:RNA polymerase sigma-70 factor (ECF subfamily)
VNPERLTFGALLRDQRAEHGFSLTSLACRVGYSKAYLSKVENGLSKPSQELARRCDNEFQTKTFTELLAVELAEAAAAKASTVGLAAEARPAPRVKKEPFEEFYAQEGRPLLGFVRKRGVPMDDARSIVQDVMVECFKNWQKIENPKAWVHKVASNRMQDYWKQEARRRSELDVDEQVDAGVRQMTTPSAEVEALSTVKRALEIFEQLPPAQKAVMVSWMAGLSTQEIADAVKLSPVSVRTHVKRGKRRLQVALEMEAAKANRDLGDRHGEGRALDNVSVVLLRSERDHEAMQTWQRAATVYQQAGRSQEAGYTLIKVGVMMLGKERHDQAVSAFDDAVKAFTQGNDLQQVGHAYMHLGHAQRATNDLLSAARSYQSAVSAFDDAGDAENRSVALNVLREVKALISRQTADLLRCLRSAAAREAAVAAARAATARAPRTAGCNPPRPGAARQHVDARVPDVRTHEYNLRGQHEVVERHRVEQAGARQQGEWDLIRAYVERLRLARQQILEGINSDVMLLWNKFRLRSSQGV